METKTLTYKDDAFDVSVTVHTSTGVNEMRRHRLQYDQRQIEGFDKLDIDEVIFRVGAYPDLVASADIVINGVSGAPDFAVFAALPGAFINEWEQAVYSVNKHWAAASEKKATT